MDEREQNHLKDFIITLVSKIVISVVFKDFASTKSNIFLLEHSNILKKSQTIFLSIL